MYLYNIYWVKYLFINNNYFTYNGFENNSVITLINLSLTGITIEI